MDINNYITSGILEDYALGMAGDQECREVECMMKIYPEIAEALRLCESDLERFASAYAKKAPADVRDAVMSKLQSVVQDPPMHIVKNSQSKEEAKEIRIESHVTEKKSSFAYWAAAAAVIAICVAAWQFAQNKSKDQRIQELAESQNILNGQTNELQNQVAQLSEGLTEMYNPAVKKVMLKSVKEGENMQMALMWNTKTGQVKLNPEVLPVLPSDKQYQLWVLKDGKPSDMGVLSKTEDGILIASNAAMEGDTFAITVEPLGGKPSPSLDQLVVMGAVG